MRRILVSFLMMVSAFPAWAQFNLLFDRVSVQQLVMVIYEECEKKGYVFDSSLNDLSHSFTMKLSRIDCKKASEVLSSSLASAGVAVDRRGDVDYFRLSPVDRKRDWKTFIYIPKFRDSVDLADAVSFLVTQGEWSHKRKSFTGGQAGAKESGGNMASIQTGPVDRLVFHGPDAESKVVFELLKQLDTQVPQVEIRAGILEFQSDSDEGSAIKAALNLFNGKLSFAFNQSGVGGDLIKIKVEGMDALFALLDQDRRFNFVSRPRVIVKDGEPAKFFAGEEIRVVGGLSLDKNGNTIQSRETLSAGVSLQATPRIRGDVVDVQLLQTVSTFSASSGTDPNILKRNIESKLQMQPGHVYVIGGLQSSRESSSSSRLFGLFETSKSKSKGKAEILLLLSVNPDFI